MTADTSRRERLQDARLYLVATLPEACPGPSPGSLPAHFALIVSAASAGASVVQLRAKRTTTAVRRALLAELRPLLPADTLLLVNDDLDAVVGPDGLPLADGVHLGREDAAACRGLAQVRERLGPDLLLGTSVRTLDELRAAIEGGADHAGFGAMAPSATKADTVLADPAELRRCLEAHPDFPLFPIGGLRPGNLELVLRAGGRRAALGSAILEAEDPAAVVHACLRRLRG